MEQVHSGSQRIAGCKSDVVRSNKHLNKITSSEDIRSKLNG